MASNPEQMKDAATAAAAAPQPSEVAPPVTADSEQVTQLMIDQAKKFNPFGSAWWIGLIQGILAILLGIFFWRDPTGSTGVLLQFVALFLVIVGLMDMMGGMRFVQRNSEQSIAFWRGVVGFVGGFVLLSLLFLGFFNSAERAGLGMNLMGIITLAYGVLGIILAFMRDARQGRWTMAIVSAIFVAIGLTLLFDRVGGLARQWVGPVLMILGVGLIIFAFMKRSSEKKAQEKAA